MGKSANCQWNWTRIHNGIFGPANADHFCTPVIIMKEDRQRPSPHTVRTIAAKAEVAEETVRRVLSALPTRQSPRERVVRAVHELGLASLLPAGIGGGR